MTLCIFLTAIEDHGNDEKFEKLYYTYEKRVLGLLYKLLENKYDAEEAAQDTFFALARNIFKLELEDESRTRAYVYKTAISKANQILRRRGAEPFVADIDCEELASEMLIDEKHAVGYILKCINGLSPSVRDALILYHAYGMNVSAIADALSISVTAARRRISRGNDLLKQVVRGEEK